MTGFADRVENERKIFGPLYVVGCVDENEILLHLRDKPWGGADVCRAHALQAAAGGADRFWRSCRCPLCLRALNVLCAAPPSRLSRIKTVLRRRRR